MKDMQQAADTMHMYFAIWIGRLQHSRASIHPALLLLLLLLLPPLLPLLRLCLLSATRSYSFSVDKKILILPQGRLPSDCWNADADVSLLVLIIMILDDLSCMLVRL